MDISHSGCILCLLVHRSYTHCYSGQELFFPSNILLINNWFSALSLLNYCYTIVCAIKILLSHSSQFFTVFYGFQPVYLQRQHTLLISKLFYLFTSFLRQVLQQPDSFDLTGYFLSYFLISSTWLLLVKTFVALNGLLCADVPLGNYSFTLCHSSHT